MHDDRCRGGIGVVQTRAWCPCFGRGQQEVAEIETYSRRGRARYWTMVRQGACHTDVFTTDYDGRGEALVIFGFEEEAGLFAGFEEEIWQVRETTLGELVSILHGPCADVERVVLDPLPLSICAGMEILTLSLHSADFTRNVTSTGGAAIGMTPALAHLRA